VAIVSNPAHDRPPLVVTLSAVVAVGAVGIWLAVHLAVGHEPDLFAAKHRYTARFAQIGGVHPGSKVRYAGVDVGTVRSVSLDSTDPAVVHVVFTVRATTPIRADTRAAIPTLFTPSPLPYLSLAPGTRRSPLLPSGSEIAVDPSMSQQDALTSLSSMIGKADSLVEVIKPSDISQLVQRMARMTARTDSMLTLASGAAHRLEPRLGQTLQRVDSMMARTDRVLATLDSSRADLAAMPHEAVATLHDSQTLLHEVTTGLQEGSGLEEMLRNLSIASDHLARLSARLDRNPLSVITPARLPPKAAGPSVAGN
jgi:phospholipid/cholesterol/gamma-HCH transport system substrate-binding protein